MFSNYRCLKLTYNASSKIYSYRGEDCGLRQRYMCELTVDDESANKIERTARLLIDKDNWSIILIIAIDRIIMIWKYL